MTDVFGSSGSAMLKALLDDKPVEEIANLAKGKLRKKIPELILALDGRVEEHHRFLLRMQIECLDEIEVHLSKLDARIEDKLQPYSEARALICEIPGMDRINSARVVAEIGTDRSIFATEGHAASWAGESQETTRAPGDVESPAFAKATPI